MSKKERQAYLDKIRQRYRRAKKETKIKILDEFCAVCDYHRKPAIRVLNTSFRRKKIVGKPRRKPTYNFPELMKALRAIWMASDQMCSKKLKAAIPLWLPHYESEYGVLEIEIRDKLFNISAATIDRLLKPIRAKYKRHGLSGTKPGMLLKNQIPIKTDNWDVTQPGFLEADTVALVATV